MLGIFTLLMMLMLTSLSAHAVSYYIAGDFTNWGTGKVEMTSDGQGQWVLPAQNVVAGQQFKVVKVDGETETWYGYNNYHVTSGVVQNGTAINVYTDNGNLDFQISGIFRFVLTEVDNHPSLVISYVPQPVTVKNGITNGTVTVDPTQALPGATVTITADPADDEFGNDDYYIDVYHITVEKTLNGGAAQVPGLKDNPGVGQFITDIQVGEVANTFTFAMPESPYGAQVSAEFQARTPLTLEMFKAIDDQDFTGEKITPPVQCAEGYNLVLNTDYTIEYGENIGPGQNTGIVNITGIGKYKGTITLYFTIKQGVHNVIVDPNIANGKVTANPTSGVKDDWITLTIEPNPGYKLKSLTVTSGDNTITPNEENKFQMPDADVNVTAEFEAIDYTITINIEGNGTVTLNPNQTIAHVGDEFTISAVAGEDYEFGSITIKDANDNVVTLTENNSFTMPASNVTINVTFNAMDVKYYVAYGVGDNWGDTRVEKLMDLADNKYVYNNLALENGMQFKIHKVVTSSTGTITESWFGVGEYHYEITAAILGTEIELNSNNSNNLCIINTSTYGFSFDPTTKKLIVTGQFLYNINIVSDHGTVTTSPVSPVAANTEVTISVTDIEAGYQLGTISVKDANNNVVTLTENNSFTMPASDVTVTVNYTPIEYTITVNIEGNGTVTLNPNQTTAHVGDEFTISAVAGEDYEFGSITIKDANDNVVTLTENNSFTMPASNVTINVTFNAMDVKYYVAYGVGDNWGDTRVEKLMDLADNKYVYNNLALENGMQFKIHKVVTSSTGTITESWFGVGEYHYEITAAILGTEIELNSNNSNNLCIINTSTYGFSFDPTTKKLIVTGQFLYNINITTTEHGSVTTDPASPVTAGTEVTIVPAPADGYEVDAISVTYGEGENITSVSVTVDNKFEMPAADVTVTVTFKETVVEYHYGAVEEVKCTVLDQTNYSGFAPEGANITMRIVPSSDTKLKEVKVYKVTGSGQDKVETPIEYTITVSETGDIDLSFVMPAMDVEVHAICADAYAVTVNAGDHGSAQANVIEAYESETVTVTTYPNTEYKVNEIYYTYTVNGVEQRVELTPGENGTYTFEMPAAPVTVVVTFKTILDYYKLKFDAAPTGGTVSVKANGETIQSMDEVAEFTPVEVTVTPDENYEIDSFKVYEGIVNADDDLTDADEVTYTVDNGIYRFEMPRTDATILVSFKQTQFVLEGVAFTAERKWATYIGSQNFVVPENVTAYVVTGVQNNAVVIDDIDYIPANVGVLLYSEVAVEQLMTTLYSGETSTYTTMLEGSATGTSTVSTNDYVLYNNNFIRSEAGSVAAHRCYLPGGQVQGAPMMLRIGNNGDVPTAIETLMAEGNVANVMYVNMSGLTSDRPFRGINIAVVTFTDGTTQTIKLVK